MQAHHEAHAPPSAFQDWVVSTVTYKTVLPSTKLLTQLFKKEYYNKNISS